MIPRISFLAALGLLFTSAFASADEGRPRPDAHAPLGVMGDHLHKKGEWMASYRYEYLRQEGVRRGGDTVSPISVLSTYGEVPTQMTMGMHMLELMYGVTGDLTVMAMPHYMTMSMTHMAHGGHGAHSHDLRGLGDTELTALYSLWRNEGVESGHRLHVNAGISLPTGDDGKTFVNHHGITYPLPYNMQFGSGTYDPILGLTYAGYRGPWSWGAQGMATIRTGHNGNGWRQGDRYQLTGWTARNVGDAASVSLRLAGESWGDVDGRDFTLPITAIAGADPTKQAGRRVMAYMGVNLLAGEAHGALAGHRFAGEIGVPLYEHYDGPAAETDWSVTLGWQYAF